MKKKILLFLLLFFLSSCSQAPSQNVDGSKGAKEVVKVSNDDYQMMVPLSESPIRGIYSNSDSDTYIDYDNMEEELLNITKEFLDVSSLFYEPGQVLRKEDVDILLSREDKDTRGLNPKKTDSIDDSTIYVNTIVEQDFYELNSENNKTVDTIALGFGIDTTYEQGGKTTTIKDEKIKDFITQYVSAKAAEYIKQEKDLDNVNIICAFYKESTDTSLPGVYYTYGMIPQGEDKISEVKEKDTEYKSYPDYSLEDDKINNEIQSFTASISNYFESYTGVSAIAKYENSKLMQLNINLVVDSYSTAEIEAFSKYVKDNVASDIKDLPMLEINIMLPSEEILSIIEYQNGKMVVDYVKR